MGPTLTKATPARSPGYVDDELAAVRKLRSNSKSQRRGEIVANGHSGSSCMAKAKRSTVSESCLPYIGG
jgi:hypothetical protein